MNTATIIKLAAATVVFVFALVWRCSVSKKTMDEASAKKIKKHKRLSLVLMLMSGWFGVGLVLTEIMGGAKGLEVEFEMFSERTNIFGISVAQTTIITWGVMAVLTVLALLFRFIVFPRFKDEPKGIQNVMELTVEAMDNYTKSVLGHVGESLSPYMLSIAFLLVGCAATELLGLRAPTSDLLVTFSLALCTFFLINLYGIKVKGFGGRIKAMASPSPVIFPMKILSDVATPVSLACRLFGNMLGGMIVMELLKSALGGYAIGITPVAGLYFNLFHPLIQVYIFITLSLTFINEAVE